MCTTSIGLGQKSENQTKIRRGESLAEAKVWEFRCGLQ